MRQIMMSAMVLTLLHIICSPVYGQEIEGGNAMPTEVRREYLALAAKIRNEIGDASAKIAVAEDAFMTNQKVVAKSKAARSKAETRYRTLVRTYLAGTTSGLEPARAQEILGKAYRAADARTEPYLKQLYREIDALDLEDANDRPVFKMDIERLPPQDLSDILDSILSNDVIGLIGHQKIDDSNAWRRIKLWGQAEGRLRSQLILVDTILEAYAGFAPVDWNIGLMQKVAGANRNAMRLYDLAARIKVIDPNDPVPVKPTPRKDPSQRGPGNPIASIYSSKKEIPEFQKWLMVRYQRAMIDEFHHIAMHGLMVDPRTLKPLAGPMRTLIAGRSLELLIHDLKLEHDINADWVDRVFEWGTTREDLAKNLELELERWKGYQIARYTAPNIIPDRGEYLLAAAMVIRTEQARIHQWLGQEYLGRDDESETVAGEYFEGLDSNMEQWARAAGLNTGTDQQNNIDAVKHRIKWFDRECDAAAGALEAAGKAGTISSLSDDQIRLLRIYGFIQPTPGGSYVIVISDEGRQLNSMLRSLTTRLDLPGAGWMSVISPEMIAITVASVVVPELIGARFATWAEGVGASRRAVAVMRVLTEMGAGAVTDASLELAQRGKIDVQSLLLESVALGGVLQLSGEASQRLTTYALRRAAARESTSALTMALRNDKAFRESLEAKLSGMLSLGTETGITAVYQGMANGEDLDMTALLSVAAQSLVGRVIGEQYATGSLSGRRVKGSEILNLLPMELQRHFKEHPEALAHLAKITDAGLQRQQEAQAAFDRIGAEPGTVDIFYALLRQDLSWSQLKLIYVSDTKGMSEKMLQVKNLRNAHFEFLARDARLIAQRAMAQHYDRRMLELEASGASQAEHDLLFKEFSREVDLINEPLVAPGSDDPTSDMDRSTRSNWMRRALRVLYSFSAHRITNGDVPTSLHAFDVNEYINIFPLLEANRDYKGAMATVTNNEFGFSFKHGQAMEALSLASAMQHMSIEDRARFKKNRVDELTDRLANEGSDKAQIAKAKHQMLEQFKFARHSRDSSEFALNDMVALASKRLNLPEDHPKTLLEARDKLYGERMEQLNKDLFRLEQMESPRSREAIELRAKIEFDLSVAMRDGIETYSSPAGLDILISEVPKKPRRNEDGTVMMGEDGKPKGMKVSDRIDDATFTRKGSMEHYSESDINSFFNDQIMFIKEHINQFNQGYETPYEAGRALGKYIERAFLALKINGLDIAAVRKLPLYDPKRRLLEFSQALAKSKGSPDDLLKILTANALRSPRTAELGMLELFRLVEQALPGMTNMTGDATPRRDGGIAEITPVRRRAVVIVQHRREEKNKLIDELFGPEILAQRLEAEKALVETEIDQIERELERLRILAGDQLISDVDTLLEVEDQFNSSIAFLASVPSDYVFFAAEVDEARQFRKRIERLKGEHVTDPEKRDAAMARFSRGFARRLDRVAYLNGLVDVILKEKEQAKERAELFAAFEKLRLEGSWRADVGAASATATIDVYEDNVTIDISWPQYAGDPPQFRIQAKRRGDRLTGTWLDLTRPSRGFEVEQGITEGQTMGLFEAIIAPGGDEFEVTQRTTDHPRLLRGETPVSWPSLIFRRGEPDAPVAKDDWVSVEMKPLSRAAPWSPVNFDIYEAGTENWVEYSDDSWRKLELPPGSYDLRFNGRPELEIHDVKFAGGEFTPPSQPALGQVQVFVESADGERNSVYFDRIYSEGKEISRQSRLPAGSYEIELKYTGQSIRRAFTVNSGQLTSMILRPGVVTVSNRFVGGSGRDLWVQVYAPGERSFAVLQTRSADAIRLAPGNYDIHVSYEEHSGPVHQTIQFNGIKLASGERQTLEANWAQLEIKRGVKSFQYVMIRAGVDTTSKKGWHGFGSDHITMDIAPGPYILRWGNGEDSETMAIQLEPGEHRVVNLD